MSWYEQSFGVDYLTVYNHRNAEQAEREVAQMMQWLRMPNQAKVLDLCCGMGRHSLCLAELGFDVTGYDLSEVLLAEARAKDTTSNVRWVQGDMRNLPFPNHAYDAVVNLFTSFGYFDEDEENCRVLSEMDKVLKPHGKWIIDYLNPDVVVSRLVHESERKENTFTIREVRTVKDGMVKKQIAICEDIGSPRYYMEQVKLYSFSDFMRMLQGTSLVVDQAFGDYSGSTFVPAASPRMILVGHKR
ncbi:class I SAM-dependent methyltransferase [Paenibacillus mendelii]|uniref:Class I SAM-dependent methyltransferase n=1 Tax=Paenibacillus mendelii TaxID=206163 RepID=A0ABV6J6A9_9BACL|nr:class I SAM-dependent methyltransferase [Paenibacillus mendelii]MCQ6559919.1 class I SAM-dependent methyltransferase [Paenibacillus mendelii]